MLWRLLKIVLISLCLLIAIPVLSGWIFYNNLTRTIPVQTAADFDALPLYKWAQIDLSDQTMCSDGSDYRIYSRRGESSNVMIHFAGGGAVWNGDTAAHPLGLTDFSGWYIPAISDLLRVILGGVFQQDNPDNPFHDWTVVYIPYCTADFDIGNTTKTYTASDGTTTKIHHNGRQNITEALDWVYATFEQPAKIVVSGESAGGYASLFWGPTIAKHYSESMIYQISDGIYLEMPEIADTVWNAEMLEHFGFRPGNDMTGSAYDYYSEHRIPNMIHLHINTLYDETLIRFEAALNDQPNDLDHQRLWSARMASSMGRNDSFDLPYFYYLTDYGLNPETGKTPHTSLSFPLFYEIQEDDVFLSDWIKRIVIDDERFSVGTEFLPE